MNFEKYRKADTIKLHGIYASIKKVKMESLLIQCVVRTQIG